MAMITHRIPWAMPYAYSEVTYDSDVEGELNDDRMKDLANHAIAMEVAVIELGGGAKQWSPAADEAIQHGAVPITGNAAPNPNPCDLCGGATKIENTKTGKRVMKCANGCKDGQWPHTVRWL